jgi:hypothetical protein
MMARPQAKSVKTKRTGTVGRDAATCRAGPGVAGLEQGTQHDGITPVRSSFPRAHRCTSSPSPPQTMVRPPATSSVTPVIQDELSDARNSVASATSSGVPIRPSGCIAATCRWVSSGIRRFTRSVSTEEDGARQLTRTPCWPHGVDSGFVPTAHRHLRAVFGQHGGRSPPRCRANHP